jgi:perosamine synthetase
MPTKQEFIPVNEPNLQGNEKRYLNECIDSGWISSEGPFVARFESMLAERVDRRFGIAVSSGTAALEVAVAALEMKPGAEVIMPSFTIISCAAAIVKAGLTPVVVDCCADTWNLDVTQLEEKITEKTEAIMVVHIYGLPTNMSPVLSLAKRFNLKVIEDAAEAIGQVCEKRPCGGFGDVSIFSFYPNKHVTTGEGGMIFCDDPEIQDRCQRLRNLCFDNTRRFIHESIGWNYRLTNLQAALGVAQTERLDETLKRKRYIGQCYHQLLDEVDGLRLPVPKTKYAENHYWVFGVILEDKRYPSARDAILELKSMQIGCRPFFFPIHLQPVFKRQGLFEGEICSESEWIAERGFYIPSGTAITDDQIEHVAKTLKECLGNHR